MSLPSFYVPNNFLTIARRRRRRPHSFATRLANYITRQFRQFGAAAQRHRVPDFGAQSLKDIQRALLPTACKPPKNGTPDSDICFYEAGSWGPQAAEELIEHDGRRWRRL